MALRLRVRLLRMKQRADKSLEDIQAVKVVANDMMTEARSLEIDDEHTVSAVLRPYGIAAQLSVIITLNSALDASIKEGVAEILSTIETLEGVSGVLR